MIIKKYTKVTLFDKKIVRGTKLEIIKPSNC